MKNVTEFVEQLVDIEFIPTQEAFGFYPFQLMAENKEGLFELNAMAFGGDVVACYMRFRDYINQDARRIYMAIDFPAGGDIETDFITVFSFENEKLEFFAIPYDSSNGHRFFQIKESEILEKIINDFKRVALSIKNS